MHFKTMCKRHCALPEGSVQGAKVQFHSFLVHFTRSWTAGFPRVKEQCEGKPVYGNPEPWNWLCIVTACLFRAPEHEWAAVCITLCIVWLVSDRVWAWRIDTTNAPTHIHPSPSSSLSLPCVEHVSLFPLRLSLLQVSGKMPPLAEFNPFQMKSHMQDLRGEEGRFQYFTFLFGAISFQRCKIVFFSISVLSQKIICRGVGTVHWGTCQQVQGWSPYWLLTAGVRSWLF